MVWMFWLTGSEDNSVIVYSKQVAQLMLDFKFPVSRSTLVSLSHSDSIHQYSCRSHTQTLLMDTCTDVVCTQPDPSSSGGAADWVRQQCLLEEGTHTHSHTPLTCTYHGTHLFNYRTQRPSLLPTVKGMSRHCTSFWMCVTVSLYYI